MVYDLKLYLTEEQIQELKDSTGKDSDIAAIAAVLNDGKLAANVFYLDNHKVIRDANELFETVKNDYLNYLNDSEFTGLCMDYQVQMPEKDILIAYANIQMAINGDTVFRYEADGTYDTDNLITCGDEDFIKDGEYADLYVGSAKDFLESFNDRKIFGRFVEDEVGDFIF